MSFRVLTRVNGGTDFIIGTAHTTTAVAGYQTDLKNALLNPDVTDIIIMDDSKSDGGRFQPWGLRLNGRP